MNIYSGSTRGVELPSVKMPSVSRPYKLFSEGGAYEITKFVQALIREPDNVDQDQQGLCSNIVDEATLFDSHQHDWEPVAWTEKSESVTEEILDYLESNSKIQSSSHNFPNCKEFPNAESKDLRDQFPQQLCGLNTSQQWLMDLPFGDIENFISHRHLQADQAFSKSLYQMEEAKAESVCDAKRANIQRMSNHNEVNDNPWIECDKTSQNFGHSHNNRYPQNGPNPYLKEHDGPEDSRQVVNSHQSFSPGQGYDLSNERKKSVFHKDDVARHCSIASMPVMGRVTNKSSMGDNFSECLLQPNGSFNNPVANTISQCQNNFSHTERNIHPQKPKDNVGMDMSTSIRGLVQTSPLTVELMKKEERRQSNLLRTNVMNAQHFISHTAYESRRYPTLHAKSKIPNSSYNHRTTHPNHLQVMFPGMIVNNCRGEISSGDDLMNHAAKLSLSLDECRAECKSLKEERQKAEAILNKAFGKPVQPVTNTPSPPNSQNDLEICQLIDNQIREQAQVANLLERMHTLRSRPLNRNIYGTLNHHQTTICITQARTKDALANKLACLRQVTYTDDKTTMLLMMSMNDLAGTTRKLRTTLWFALQMTLPEPVKVGDHHDCSEEANPESTDEGYSFRF